jgi:hypothetical protein
VVRPLKFPLEFGCLIVFQYVKDHTQQGGLDSAKKALQGAVMLPLLQPQMFGDGNRQVYSLSLSLVALCLLSLSFL